MPALNMKFQLPELSLPSSDKIANSLAATIRININSLMKWVSLRAQGRNLLKIWRPLKEVTLLECHCQVEKKNARETSMSSSEGPGVSIRNWSRRRGGFQQACAERQEVDTVWVAP